MDDDSWQSLAEAECSAIEMSLIKNPKSYGAWHHRDWIFKNIPHPSYKEELNLCDRYIQKDQRNFHCWDYRRLIVERSGINLGNELEFTKDLIDQNFSNYSAWHYRSILLPVLHPPSHDSTLPIAEETFLKELEKVIMAVFTDPSDQSPWFFLRWLICKKKPVPRLVQVGHFPSVDGAGFICLSFSDAILLQDISVELMGEDNSHICLQPTSNPCIWLLRTDSFREEMKLRVNHKDWLCEEEVSIQCSSIPAFHWVSKELPCQRVLSDSTKRSISRVISDCVTLDELDPGNKWVLLTLVEAMLTVDVKKYQTEILSYLNQLQRIDLSRANYYKDFCSKIIMDCALMDYLNSGSSTFTLSEMNLTCLKSCQYLLSAEVVDLRWNHLRFLESIGSLINCRELVLDGNELKNLYPISRLKLLTILSINNCGITSVEQLEPLSHNTSLITLSLAQNSVIETPEFKNFSETVLSFVKTVHIVLTSIQA